MSPESLKGYLDRMYQAAAEVSQFIEGMDKDAFLKDVVKQRAVGMNLLMVEEVATRVMEAYPEFVEEHSDLPWRELCGMRNRIAHPKPREAGSEHSGDDASNTASDLSAADKALEDTRRFVHLLRTRDRAYFGYFMFF